MAVWVSPSSAGMSMLAPVGPSPERCASVLEHGRRFLVVTHESPDGDAVGSALALALALGERGRQAVVYAAQGIPAHLRFLPGADRVVREVGPDQRFDVCVACDAADPARMGPDLPGPDRRGLVLVLDHHPGTRPFGDVALIDPEAAAAGVLVHRVLKAWGHPISREVAVCLWTSIASDTGDFRHSNTNAEALRIGGELVERGADPGEISSRMHESQPLGRLRLLAEVLGTLSLASDGRVAHLTVAREAMARAGTLEEVTDGFIGYPRSVAGVEVAVLFLEEAALRARVSFRSRKGVDVREIAARFGGGGHRSAAGCSVSGTLDEVRARVLREVDLALGPLD